VSAQDGRSALVGNGVGLVRELALAKRVQSALERLYQLERAADVCSFMSRAEDGEREALLVRDQDGHLELALRIPELGVTRAFDLDDAASLDALCQIIEGVSHFVYLTDRAEAQRETTQLELEVQAEVDKYVVLTASIGELTTSRSARVRERLFEQVNYVHDAHTDLGSRYRAANECARRFTKRLEREFVARCRFGEMQHELRRFYRMGQADKLRAA
jgi:hypothetical protein